MTLPTPTQAEATLLLGLLFACYTDIRWWRIPNALNLVLIALGLLINTLLGQWQVGVFGLLLAFAVHFPLWVLQVQKGGDAKLMMGLGALVGPALMIETTLWKLLLLIPVGFVILLVSGNLSNLRGAVAHILAKAQGKDAEAPPKLTYMPFAPVIAVAWGCAMITDWFDFW